jgi:AraC-like DNA-binding protein
LLDETRYRIARQLLRDTLLGVEELAVTLGYADATAFSRAFRRWSGTSPSRWRATQPRG